MKLKTYWIAGVLLCAGLTLNISERVVLEQDLSRSGQDYALFFAVNNYRYMDDLQNPIKNAREIAAALESTYGFRVEVVENPSLDQIDQKLAEYERKFTNGTFSQKGQLFVYFSGHGLYERGNGYFMTTNANPATPQRTAMEYDYYRGLIDEIPCQHIMVAIDACHSAAFDPTFATRSDRRFGRPDEKDLDRILTNHENFKARVFWTSDGVGDQTPDRSQFAYKLLEGLRATETRNGYLTSSILYSQYLEEAAPRPGGGRFGNDDPSSCFLFFKENYNANYDPQEEQLWQLVSEQNTITGYQFYEQSYPGGKYEEEAQRRVSNLNLSPIKSPSLEREGWGGSTTTTPDNFIRIPGGTFQMGDTFGEGDSKEKPTHQVEVSTFYMSKYETTFAEYDAYCTATGKNEPKDKSWGRGQRPAIYVSWCDALEYANWLSKRNGLQPVYSGSCENIRANWNANGYRLPTEAEWEYAAREGGKQVRFGNGKDVIDPAAVNFNGNAKYKQPYSIVGEDREKTIAVGSLNSPNSLGLHDMSGNVYEWCWDWYSYDYYNNAPKSNPRGADLGEHRVRRGGGWSVNSQHCRATNRTYGYPVDHRHDLGFRLVRTPSH